MADLASLDANIIGVATRFHNFAKTIETFHLGYLYTTAIDNIDYYVVEGVAKPLLAEVPGSVSDNGVVKFILDHKGISILTAGLISFVSFMIWVHPRGGADKPKDPTTDKPPAQPEKKDDTKGSDDATKEANTNKPKDAALQHNRKRSYSTGDKRFVLDAYFEPEAYNKPGLLPLEDKSSFSDEEDPGTENGLVIKTPHEMMQEEFLKGIDERFNNKPNSDKEKPFAAKVQDGDFSAEESGTENDKSLEEVDPPDSGTTLETRETETA